MSKLPLIRTSFCSCGYSVLNDHIIVGTVYDVDPTSIRHGFTYICGRCCVTYRGVDVINAKSIDNPAAPMRPLPLALFEQARQ